MTLPPLTACAVGALALRRSLPLLLVMNLAAVVSATAETAPWASGCRWNGVIDSCMAFGARVPLSSVVIEKNRPFLPSLKNANAVISLPGCSWSVRRRRGGLPVIGAVSFLGAGTAIDTVL